MGTGKLGIVNFERKMIAFWKDLFEVIGRLS
jgi:hypothetical protein